MSFGGGFQNGQYQNLPPFNGMGQVQPPLTGMPIYPGMPVMPMPSVHPGMMPPVPLQTSYPAGQGPLASRPVQRGANGLLEAPEAEGPEQHEASQYIKLNPAEEMKYNEYWSQACEGAETVSGSHAVEFLSRAAKVSKGQLRRIWDIADSQKEGSLDQQKFYIALRMLALAQRGAELSIAGLRNFTGIQLVPSIDPPPKKEPEDTAGEPESQKPFFSWTITPEVAVRYDNYFKSLDNRNAGVIDGKQGVTFFGKSGLPRPTLKKIWGLADVTQDGLLSLDEFRTAMHMVTCIRNKRIAVTALPETLDPNGPNWLRVAGADASIQASPTLVSAAASVPPGEAPPSGAPLSPENHGVHSPQHAEQAGSPPLTHPLPPTTAAAHSIQHVESPPQQPISPRQPGISNERVQPQIPAQPVPQPLQVSQPQSFAQESAAMRSAAEEAEKALKEAENMREALRKEKLEFEQARHEMQEMRAEMERLRLERESLSTLPAVTSPIPPTSPPPPITYGQGSQVLSSTAALPTNHRTMFRAPTTTPMTGPVGNRSYDSQEAGQASHIPQASAPQPVHQQNAAVLPAPVPSVAPVSPPPVQSAVANRDKPIDLGGDDDDIWDQPSPKSSALPGPANLARKEDANNRSQDSVSSDDDDDFWGAGMAPKPTLGPTGGQKAGQAGGKGFGGSELDDWVF